MGDAVLILYRVGYGSRAGDVLSEYSELRESSVLDDGRDVRGEPRQFPDVRPIFGKACIAQIHIDESTATRERLEPGAD